jgi:hypothetical protein
LVGAFYPEIDEKKPIFFYSIFIANSSPGIIIKDNSDPQKGLPNPRCMGIARGEEVKGVSNILQR